MKPVADGEVGQLCAGGGGLALGYLNDTERTSERFVPDPYASGSRLYLTGDLVKRRPDGALEFIGRRDRQIKIDGKRVEIGEIEQALRRNPEIVDAIVVMHQDGSTRRLIGYVKARSGPDRADTFGPETLAKLRCELPAHMIPSEIFVLAEFPLTPNGKVDIARLPVRKIPAAASSPKNALEGALADIFKGVLGLPAIEPERNFFDLGATSLNLLEAHERITRLYGDVDVIALFEHTNIRDLARFLGGKQAGAPRREAMPSRIQRQSEAFKRLRSTKLAQ
jgi:hypothetical protein